MANFQSLTFLDPEDTGLGGLALCLLGGAKLGGGVKPLTIVVSFDGGEQVVPDGIPGWGTSLVHESDFFHRCPLTA